MSTHGYLFVKQYGVYSQAGNVGRTGTSKINQDSVFVSKIAPDGRALTTKEQIKQGPLRADWFCAVADGHGANGHYVSQFIQQHMPKQYESEKRKFDRQRTAKDLVQGYKNHKAQHQAMHGGSDAEQPWQEHSDSKKDEELSPVEANDRRIRKALVTCYLQVQQKLEK